MQEYIFVSALLVLLRPGGPSDDRLRFARVETTGVLTYEEARADSSVVPKTGLPQNDDG